MQYTDKVVDHFRNPRNVGEIKNPDGAGEVGSPVCGDMMTLQVMVKDNVLTDIKFKTFGCGAAIASASMITEMAKGMTLEQALKITDEDVAKELGGLPPHKLHCSNLGADALHAAINNYLEKQQGKGNPDKKEIPCNCPYVEEQQPGKDEA